MEWLSTKDRSTIRWIENGGWRSLLHPSRQSTSVVFRLPHVLEALRTVSEICKRALSFCEQRYIVILKKFDVFDNKEL